MMTELESHFDPVALSFHDTMQNFTKNKLMNKLNDREALIGSASKSISNFFDNRKELLQKENENQNNFLDQRKDHMMIRAREKNQLKESLISNNIEKFINKERPAITQYFDNYVNNYRSDFAVPDNNEAEIKKLYSQELLHQINKKHEGELERQQKAEQEEREGIEKAQAKHRSEMIKRRESEKRKNESLLYTNLKLMDEKRKKEIVYI